MSDIVDELRSHGYAMPGGVGSLLLRAATEIERLRTPAEAAPAAENDHPRDKHGRYGKRTAP